MNVSGDEIVYRSLVVLFAFACIVFIAELIRDWWKK